MKPSMMDYILRQPQILQQVFSKRETFLQPVQKLFADHSIRRIYFFGSGTSYHVSCLGAVYFSRYLNIETSSQQPVLFCDTETVNPSGVYQPGEVLAVGVSQSGTSTSTIEALKYAKQQGCLTMCFSQDETSEAVRISDVWLPMLCEKEMVPPETQGYTAALLTLYVLAYTLAGKAADCDAATEAFLKTDLPVIIERSRYWVQEHLEEFANAPKLSIYGSALNSVTAMEGALKIGETLKRIVGSYEAEEFAHLIDLSFLEDDYCIALVHPSAHPQRNIEIINLARSITNHVFVISPHLNASVNDLELGIDFSEELSPISFVIPLQLLAAMTAEKLGIDTSVFPHPDVQSIAHSADYFLYNS